uniref:RAS like family 10 member A n=1 Tax=Macrostomum lignano TaxID=282301 RepID=A0A1I8FIG5_9PLAT
RRHVGAQGGATRRGLGWQDLPVPIDLLTTPSLVSSRPSMPADCCGRRQITPGRTGLSDSRHHRPLGHRRRGAVQLTSTLFTTKAVRLQVVCYDLADYNTLLKSSFWISDLSMRLPDAAIFLCGCKSDLLLSLYHKSDYLACRPRLGHQVTELFEAVAACCLVTCRRKSLLHQKLHPKVVSEISTGDQQSPIYGQGHSVSLCARRPTAQSKN